MSNDEVFIVKKQANHQSSYWRYGFFGVCLIALNVLAVSLVTPDILARLEKNYGKEAYQRGLALKELLESLKDKRELEKLVSVNQFFNQVAYVEDLQNWQQTDYWATPEEFIGVNAGDCEDYVIAKYFALKTLGIDEEKLYLTYVKSTKFNVAHMVLSYFKQPGSIPLVLDNYESRILSADNRKDLLPVYSFNVKALFLTNSSAGLGKQLPTDKVKNSKWTELLKSMQGDNE